MARGEDGIVFTRVIDFVLVKRDMLKYVHNVKTVRGISYHSVVHCKVKLVWRCLEERRKLMVLKALRMRS